MFKELMQYWVGATNQIHTQQAKGIDTSAPDVHAATTKRMTKTVPLALKAEVVSNESLENKLQGLLESTNNPASELLGKAEASLHTFSDAFSRKTDSFQNSISEEIKSDLLTVGGTLLEKAKTVFDAIEDVFLPSSSEGVRGTVIRDEDLIVAYVKKHNLKKGIYGSAYVTELQRMLTEAGYPVPTTGNWINQTQAAYEKYLKDRGLAVETAIGAPINSDPPEQKKIDKTTESTSTVPAISSSQIKDLMVEIPRPSRDSVNQGLIPVSNAFMLKHLGNPRDSYDTEHQPMTNPILKKHIVKQSVGPFEITGLRPAVESMRSALAQVQREQPTVYAALTGGSMLCCRLVRGSKTSISNHSWGTAIDFMLNGKFDPYGNNKVYTGMMLMAPILNQHGWYWGVVFRTEDGMHFEASQSLVAQWASNIK